jgi:predicted protein tyrosine phosphatase
MNVELYLRENIDHLIRIQPWVHKSVLPVFLRNNYNFYEATILATPCILLEAADEMPGLEKLQKHVKQIETLTKRQIVLLYKKISRYRRKSLIENRIPFVIADGQMYLPFLALDLKKGQETAGKTVKRFTSSAQLAFLYFLYHKEEVVNMTRFAQKMGFTRMKASRALNDLYSANLITCEIGGKTGRSKEYQRIPDPDYFVKGRGYLKSPVKKIVYSMTKPVDALSAGLDALASLSMLNPPEHRVVAMAREKFFQQKIEIIKNKDLIKDAKLVELQLWDYDPRFFADGNHVDLLSLYASLTEENDERVEQALFEVLRGEKWYTD